MDKNQVSKQPTGPLKVGVPSWIEYEKTVFVEEALHRLVEVYYRLGLIEEARQAASYARKWFERIKMSRRCRAKLKSDDTALLANAKKQLAGIQGNVKVENYHKLIKPLTKFGKKLEISQKKKFESRFSAFKLQAKFCLFSVLFSFIFAGISMGVETIHALDFSGNGPLFLSNKQIKEDLAQAERLLRENYVRYPILEKTGVNWKKAFQKMADHFLTNKNPTLTHHFQKQLIY